MATEWGLDTVFLNRAPSHGVSSTRSENTTKFITSVIKDGCTHAGEGKGGGDSRGPQRSILLVLTGC